MTRGMGLKDLQIVQLNGIDNTRLVETLICS